ncbi:Methionine import system permease protein MetP [Slackia heliotrinireducens]|uniref:ABC-type metal ion transport system, permease component n=1 Tax=Slackia heliotrinireducens (strain ATCC 29202 / DSM 20476 / NCTC 11029 / RHS 1) TaxID=471855 RepID=C7N2S9_SLAHD|nr:ABC transporter permease subunit [Slackia heliotrinireducens]ACV23587.1 ABC-type metal ion transport system, permease component [Slackia heliotrinireducens DSM 20476]VEH03044.1 Methionine import system permease protein MetP [Slackia heliotrinireducens]
MTFATHSLQEIIASAFSAEVWALLGPACLDTLYMILMATVLTFGFGTLIGIVLAWTNATGLDSRPAFYQPLSALINALRSLPSMIMIILTLPLARAITGKGYGANACIIALAMSCIPMCARLVETALLEVDRGKIEAAKAMGASNTRIMFTVVLPEAVPSIFRSFGVVVIAILSMTALAGAFGAGGIGNIAVQYGFNRFRYDILIATVLILVVFAELVQLMFEGMARMVLKRRKML